MFFKKRIINNMFNALILKFSLGLWSVHT